MPFGINKLMNQYVKPTLYEEAIGKIREIFDGQKLFVSFAFSCNGLCYCSNMGCRCDSIDDHVEVIEVAMGVLKPGQHMAELDVPLVFYINTVANPYPPCSQDKPTFEFLEQAFLSSLVCNSATS